MHDVHVSSRQRDREHQGSSRSKSQEGRDCGGNLHGPEQIACSRGKSIVLDPVRVDKVEQAGTDKNRGQADNRK